MDTTLKEGDTGQDDSKTLTAIANELHLDKGDLRNPRWRAKFPIHPTLGYTHVYEKYMSSHRHDDVKLLEIGISDIRFPFGSLHMWRRYFSKLELYGMDNFWGRQPPNNTDTVMNSLGATLIFANQGSLQDWRKIQQELKGKLDYIIEDGSHQPGHMMLSLWAGIDLLKSGGIYFMEDIQNPEKTRGFFGYDNSDLHSELGNWSLTTSSKHIDEAMFREIKHNYDFLEMFGNLHFLAVFRRK